MMQSLYLDIYNAANRNARQLLDAGNLLCDAEQYAQAYVLGFSALEEISKGQFAADVFTGLKTEKEFKNLYRDHLDKIERASWAHFDANTPPYNLRALDPNFDNVKRMKPAKPNFRLRQNALYVDIDFRKQTVTEPEKIITEKDARDILHVVDVALIRIWEITGEFGGMQIGTKGFMK